jgi:hypothetical protein
MLCVFLISLSGCKRHGDPYNMSGRTAEWAAAKQSARQDLTQIPPPSKSTYLAIDHEAEWQNPFLTVESNMIQLRIYLADENYSSVDRGGITRLSAARKHILNIRPKDLPRALASLPDGAWPYGRVIALVVERTEPPNQARLNNDLVVTIAALNDMGIVADDWTNPLRQMH